MTKKAHDVLNDNSHVILYKIAKSMDFKIPPYVESGVPLEKEAAARTETALFADEKNRMFPITDRANTWLSGAYFAKTASDHYQPSEYKAVALRILKAAELYGISKDVQEVMGKIASESISYAKEQSEKTAASVDLCYGEPETEGFPMFTKEQTKLACDYFEKNAYAYDWRRRASIAKNILRKAAEYGIRPNETVRKEAGAGFPRRDFLAENLMTRETELDRRGLHKLASDMRKTIKVICEADPEDLMGQLESLREMISGADELGGLDEDYGRRFNPPADFLFDISDDAAKEFKDDAIDLDGQMLSAKALADLPRKLFERVMSSKDVDGMTEDGKLSPSKISITIIKMTPRDKRNLLNTIQDFTANAGDDYDDEVTCDDNECIEETCDKED